MDHYLALEAEPTDSQDQLRRAYLKQARKFHPDQLTDASPATKEKAEVKMREVNEAWDVLGDKARRLRYDQNLFEAHTETVREEWKPFDDSDVPEYMEPVVPGRAKPPTWLTATPPLAVGIGIVVTILGAMTVMPLFLLGLFLVTIGAISFVFVPFAVMVMSARSERPQ